MIEAHQLLLPLAVIVVCAVGGFAFAWWRDVRAGGALERVARGRGLTVPVLVSVAGDTRRAQAVLDDGVLRVVGARTQLLLDGRAYANAAQRRHHLDDELLDFATQRGFVDAAGTRYLVGALEEWEPALTAALQQPPRPASRWRRLAAAVPRRQVAGFAAATMVLLAFQGIWAAGHDVTATMVRVVGEEGLESCAVRWAEDGAPGYAEVDCYAPFPAPGSPVVVRVLAAPFAGRALDHEGTYEGLTVIPGGLALVLGALVVGTTVVRVRRPAIRLAPQPGPALDLTTPEPVTIATDAPLFDQLDALARVEGWSEGVTAAPPQPWYQAPVVSLASARWWPVPLLAGIGLLVEELPEPVRYALGAAAVAVALWAALGAWTTWRTIHPASTGPVTSEWDYSLVRLVDDEWLALLVLGQRPHWLVPLMGERHPAPTGRCGVRGDLRDGGAVQLLVDGEFWMSGGPVERVDDEMLSGLREEVTERLQDLGGHRDAP
ncbi:hypothetical protein [Oryzobacter telluris]|uniref:hypothetical protein n=1 Tax=Oryzobacter telluris TaxID=3149179 RepID=UPI00370D0803